LRPGSTELASALALGIYVPLLLLAALLVWRRPARVLFVFVVGLAAHNFVMALLWGAGVRGAPLDVIQAWKEALLAGALARVAADGLRGHRLPFRPGLADGAAIVFAGLVVVYAVLPQSALDGQAGPKAILYGLRHALVPVAAYLLGRALPLSGRAWRALVWTVVGAAVLVAAFGIVEEYTVPNEWWRSSGAVGYFRDQLGFRYHGPAGLPENFAFNTSSGLYRRLVSTFISPLGAGYMLLVALVLASTSGSLRRAPKLLVGAVVVVSAGLLFTFSRSSIVALAGGFVVLAAIRRTPWAAAAAALTLAVGLGFAAAYPSIAPRTHWFAADLPYQIARAKQQGPLPRGSGLKQTVSLGEPSIRSHLDSLRDGLKTVGRHPQGYGLGNGGQTASRFGVPLKAGESTYTEVGVDVGLAGMIIFVGWSVLLLRSLVVAAVRTRDDGTAAAGVAAAFAAVLALALQTDVLGVPWLAYCLWGAAGLAAGKLRERAPGI
jgi:hypothetical protein